MKVKTFILSLFLTMFCSTSFGQHWGEIPNHYEGNMTFVTQIFIDDVLQGEDIEIGAFCGNEFRGSARPIASQSNMVYLLIEGDGDHNGDQISFKLARHYADNTSVELDYVIFNALTYEHNARIGASPADLVNGLLPEDDRDRTEFNSVASLNGEVYPSLANALAACTTGNNTIELLKDNAEDVTIKQVEGVNITIDGGDNNRFDYSGTITIHGNARHDGAETLTFTNIDFTTDKAGHYFIDSNSTDSDKRYAHNVTVDDCNFTATDAGVNSAVAMRIRQGFDIAINGSTFTDLHSALQAYGNAGITVSGITLNGKNGISAGTSTGVVIENSNITATGYGLRADGTGAYDMTLKGANTITAELPVVVRNTTGAYKLTVESGTYTALNGNPAVTFTTGDDGTFVAPTADATATIADGVNVTTFGLEAKIANDYYTIVANAATAASNETGDQTIVLIKDATSTVNPLNVEILDLNAKTLTANVIGKVKTNGGLWITPENFKMIGVGADYYTTDNATIVMGANYALRMTEGTVTLAQSWRTLPGQTVAIESYAKFIVPAGMTYQIYGTAVAAAGTLEVNGTVQLAQLDATLTAEAGLNVVSGVDDYVVKYENGVYKLGAGNVWNETKDKKYATLAEAITAATAGDKLVLLADITENVTVSKNLTIDGANDEAVGGKFNYTGTMTANAGLTVTVQNIDFVGGGFDKSTKSTTGNYTIKNCTFEDDGDYAYPVRIKGASSVTIEDCTVKNYLYSFLYITSGTNKVSVKNVTVEDCSNYAVYFASGVNTATIENLTVKNADRGLLINNTANRALTLINCKLENVGTAVAEANGTNTITCTLYGNENDFGTSASSQYAKYVLADVNATLTAPEGYNVESGVDNLEVIYKNGCYSLYGLSGLGTEAEPFLIYNLEDLKFFRDHVNAGKTRYNAENVYVALAANIDMLSEDWSVNIGDDCNSTFDGIFDGQGHTLYNLNSTETAQKADGYVCTGLFGAIYGNAVIKNLTIENVNINTGEFTGNNVAAVVGFVYGFSGKTVTIDGVKVTGDINIDASGVYGVGAIVGYSYNQGTLNIKNCAVEANDESAITAVSGSGAIIGYCGGKATIEACSVQNIDITAKGLVGGIAGITENSVNKVLSGNTVKDVTLTATKAEWVNSTAIAVGTMDGNGLTVANTIFENVYASRMVGSVYAEQPTYVVPAVEARIENKYYGTFDAALAAAQEGNTITVLAPVVITEDKTYDLTGLSVDGENVYPIFRIQNGANVVVANGNISNDDYVFVLGASNGSSAGNLTIESGVYTGTTTVASVTKGLLKINGGEFKVNDSEYGATYMINCIDANYNDDSANVEIYGGKFYGFNPEDNDAEGANTNFCAQGYAANEIETGVYEVVAGNVLNQTTGKKYATLQAAIDAAENGDEIVVLKDITLGTGESREYTTTSGGTVSVRALNLISGKSVTIDLNGKTLYCEEEAEENQIYNFFAVTEEGHLTIKDSSEDGTGTVEIKNNDADATTVHSLIMCYNGTMTIENGNYKLHYGKNGNGMIYSQQNETVTVNGGNFWLGNVGTLENHSPWIFNASGRNGNRIIVNGGTFNDDVLHQYYAFEVESSVKNALVNNNNGTWSVITNGAVAHVTERYVYPANYTTNYTNTVGYATLKDAFAAAHTYNYVTEEEMSTVTMLKNVTLDAYVTISKSVNLNLDQFNITRVDGTALYFNGEGIEVTIDGEGTVSGTQAVYVDNGTVTINGGNYVGGYEAVYVINNGHAVINGGTFGAENDEDDTDFVLNEYDATRDVTTIAVYGGTFHGFNPENNAAEGAGTNFCAEGYGAVETAAGSNIWVVMPVQKQSLVAGWNWYSSYLKIKSEDLLLALGTNGSAVVSDNGGGDAYYDESYGWDNSLTENLDLSKMYMIETSIACDLNLAGELADASTITITLNPGWNWIGYPSNVETRISDAFSGFTPNNGDVIKTKANSFAEYYEGQWYDGGVDMTMEPTKGYMYYNASLDVTKTFTYNIVPVTTRGNNETAVATHYSVDYTKYPFNMTMVAVVDGAMNDNYEVAALVNGEVRGSARPVYIESMDAYMLFLSINGDAVEEMTFKYYDLTTGEEYDLVNRIDYSNNAMIGSVNEPYE